MDKAEWYKGDLFGMYCEGKSIEDRFAWLHAQNHEERTVALPRDYEWLLSSEIQTYWEVLDGK